MDSLLLGFLGSTAGNFAFNQLGQSGSWGILIGFFIGGLYFASMDCRIGNGQTIGKRLLKIRVINANGEPLSFGRALVRYTVFAIPTLLYGWRHSMTKTPSFVLAITFVAVYWIGGSTFYLILFDRTNRRGIHDWAAKSSVVYADHEGPVAVRAVPQMHWAILGSLLLIISASSAALNDWSERQPTQLEFRRDMRMVENLDGVQRAFLRERLIHSFNSGVKKVLYINVWRKAKPDSEEEFAHDVVKLLLHSDPNIQSYDLVNVRLVYGFDIGIASSWKHREFEQSPSAWAASSFK